MVGIAAKVSPIEQHFSFADVQFALGNKYKAVCHFSTSSRY
jgi:hypothetical protein